MQEHVRWSGANKVESGTVLLTSTALQCCLRAGTSGMYALMFWMSDTDTTMVQVQYQLPTHPIPGRSTRRAAVPQQIQPQ